jgi:hypothetical protein
MLHTYVPNPEKLFAKCELRKNEVTLQNKNKEKKKILILALFSKGMLFKVKFWGKNSKK